MNIFFISGTDTNVGKTEITCALMRVISNQDKTVVGMKPISAGVDKIREGYLNKDVDKIMNAASFSYDISKVNSYSFDEPIAPHIAADKVNCSIDFNLIQNNLNQIKEKADYVFIEGAGGHEVPLDKTRTMADLVTSLDIPIILVVGIRLGCINHSILTINSILNRKQKLFGWVANCIDKDMSEIDKNISYLKEKIPSPLIGIVPYQENIDTEIISSFLVWPD